MPDLFFFVLFYFLLPQFQLEDARITVTVDEDRDDLHGDGGDC